MKSLKKVNKICKAIAAITNKEFAELLEIAEAHREYVGSMKTGQKTRLTKEGKNNLKIISALIGIRRRVKLFKKIIG